LHSVGLRAGQGAGVQPERGRRRVALRRRASGHAAAVRTGAGQPRGATEPLRSFVGPKGPQLEPRGAVTPARTRPPARTEARPPPPVGAADAYPPTAGKRADRSARG